MTDIYNYTALANISLSFRECAGKGKLYSKENKTIHNDDGNNDSPVLHYSSQFQFLYSIYSAALTHYGKTAHTLLLFSLERKQYTRLMLVKCCTFSDIIPDVSQMAANI